MRSGAIPSGIRLSSTPCACARASLPALAIRKTTRGPRRPTPMPCAPHSTPLFGPSCSPPPRLARRALTFTTTATRSCTGTCRQIRLTSSSGRAEFTASRTTPCARTWRFATAWTRLRWAVITTPGRTCSRRAGETDLVPYWLYPLAEGAVIRRHVPILPLSQEVERFEALRRSLAVYRLAFGQSRQEDLVAYLLEQFSEEEVAELIDRFRIDLSPPLDGAAFPAPSR